LRAQKRKSEVYFKEKTKFLCLIEHKKIRKCEDMEVCGQLHALAAVTTENELVVAREPVWTL
jgi:hypothetical protein